MACSCYDELAALYVKFETIYELCEEVLAKLGSGFKEYKTLADDILIFIAIITPIIDGEQ